MNKKVFTNIRSQMVQFIKDYDQLKEIQQRNPDINLQLYIDRMQQYYDQIPLNIIEDNRKLAKQSLQKEQQEKATEQKTTEQISNSQYSQQCILNNLDSIGENQIHSQINQVIEEYQEEDVEYQFVVPSKKRQKDNSGIGLVPPNVSEVLEKMTKYQIESRILTK